MEKIYLNDILKALNINVKSNNILIYRVKNNIKKLGEHTLIFHLNKDEEVDQEEFKKYNTCYIVTDQPILNSFINKDKYLYVDNIFDAYRQFTDYYRNLFDLTVIAVTGTCGKTTTKEMIAQVLKKKYKVVNTIGSKNNIKFHHDYLTSINRKTDYAVFETAITHPGHLIYNCEFFKPQIGIITNIGIDHLNWCKTLNNYIRTKAEILVGLRNKGHLIINNDDANIKKIDFLNYKGKIITFGTVNNSDYFGKDIKQLEDKIRYTLVYKNKEYIVDVPGNGNHNVYNSLATIACLGILGMSIEEARHHISSYKPIRSHTEIKKGISDSIIIDDTWSSNPTSMKAALDVLSEQGKNKTKIAVIGKISYLGDFKSSYYKQIAQDIIKHDVNILITIDKDSKKIAKYAVFYGMDKSNVMSVDNKEDLSKILNRLLNNNTVALFKTSMLDKNSQELIKEIEK